MIYNIIEERNKIILKDMRNFHPKHIFECGQAFRWEKKKDLSYNTIAFGKLLNVKKEDGDIILTGTNLEDFQDIWYNYFDLDRDYDEIKKKLSLDPILEEAIEFGSGIRILNQEPFETIISFIISANNQIPRIKKSIELISMEYGDRFELPEVYYSFPTAEKLSKALPEDLRAKTKVGFRDKRIVETSKKIYNGDVDLEEIFNINRNQGKELLMELPGIGPKVSDCILLFAFNKADAFPVDVWVKRVMEHFYLKKRDPCKAYRSFRS